MSDIKQPRFVAPDQRGANALRDFVRGMQTKNMVKGAGGGALGVDYQDSEAEYAARKANTPVESKSGQHKHHRAFKEMQAANQQLQAKDSSDPAQVVSQDAQISPAQRPQTPLDIREDDPRKKHKFSGGNRHDDEELPSEDRLDDLLSQDLSTMELAERDYLLHILEKLLQDPTTERKAYGALALTQPDDIKKLMGTPVRCAKHLLILAGNFIKNGAPREDVLTYLAEVFMAFGTDFGRRAFKDFSINVGIGAVYPLEVRERCLSLKEDFLPTTTRARFTTTKRWLQGKIKETIVLEYPADLILTEFAVKGGTRNGYQMLPLKEPGQYGLRFFIPGEYQLLLLCQDPLGFERLEQIRVTVEGQVAAIKTTPTQRAFSWKPRKSAPSQG
jgi:hypothetical protein